MYIRHYKTAQLRLTSAAQNINIVISNSGINEDAKISLPPPGRKSDFENLLLYDINKTPRIIILALLDALRTISFKNITVPDLLLRANIILRNRRLCCLQTITAQSLLRPETDRRNKAPLRHTAVLSTKTNGITECCQK